MSINTIRSIFGLPAETRPMADCPECGGWGREADYLPAAEEAPPCDECGGDGRVVDEDYEQCDGEGCIDGLVDVGDEWVVERPCPRCEGTGWLHYLDYLA
jgi:DnaJ-class molecular chaperone